MKLQAHETVTNNPLRLKTAPSGCRPPSSAPITEPAGDISGVPCGAVTTFPARSRQKRWKCCCLISKWWVVTALLAGKTGLQVVLWREIGHITAGSHSWRSQWTANTCIRVCLCGNLGQGTNDQIRMRLMCASRERHMAPQAHLSRATSGVHACALIKACTFLRVRPRILSVRGGPAALLGDDEVTGPSIRGSIWICIIPPLISTGVHRPPLRPVRPPAHRISTGDAGVRQPSHVPWSAARGANMQGEREVKEEGSKQDKGNC